MNAVEANKINVWYGKFHALKNVSFEIPEGSIVGLVGPNGAGKTTLIKTIMGLIKYKGILKKSNNIIGYLSEEEGYYEFLTGYEYLMYFGKLYGLHNPKQIIKKVLNMVGLYGREKDIIKSYSKGMKRRLGVARTLLSNSNLIIFDEPMSGLDPKMKAELRDIILSISHEKTFIISSHQLRDIEEICNWLIMIDHGKIINYGKPGDILQKIHPHRIITLYIENLKKDNIDDINLIDGVKKTNYRNNVLTIIYDGSDDSKIFNYLIQNNLKFTLKSDSIESIYREVYK